MARNQNGIGTNSVELTDVVKNYQVKGRDDPVLALRGLDLTIPHGAMVAIKGPSGSGKTTLLQLIGALDTATKGKVVIDGKDLSQMNEAELTAYRAHTIGFVFQTFNLIPNLTAIENVELAMEATGVPTEERAKRALALLKRVNMVSRKDHMPLKLSGGEQQRVAIARALANRPSIILADEPTGALDSKTGRGIISLMNQLRKDKRTTVIIVTHDTGVAKRCDEVFTIEDGQITSGKDLRTSRESEADRRRLKELLSLPEKVVSRLVAGGFGSITALQEANLKELSEALGNKKKAGKILAKVADL